MVPAGRAVSAEHDLRALLVQSAAAQRGSVCTAVRQPGRAGGDLQKGAPALDALLEADDVPDPGHPAGRTGGSPAELAPHPGCPVGRPALL